MKKIAILIASLSLLLMPLLVAAIPSTTYADANSDVRQGIDQANSSGAPSVDNIIAIGLNLFSFVIGVVAVIMVMIAGFRFITANGDANQVSGARTAIIYAIVGLAVVALSQIIVQFTLHKVTLPKCPPGQTQISKPGDCTP